MLDMPVKKLSIALEESVAEQAAACAERDGVSLSAWINAAAAHALHLERGHKAVREWEVEHGELTAQEQAWAASTLDGNDADWPGSP